MCRNNPFCTELGTDPAKWSRDSPLPPPPHFSQARQVLLDVIAFLDKGEIEGAKSALEAPLEDEIKAWYIEHGQMSGEHRYKGLGSNSDAIFYKKVVPRESTTPFEEQVYARDGYLCQYCSNPVFRPKDLMRIEDFLGKSHFAVSAKSNLGRHGFIYTQRATADHVVPHNRGGETSLDNLVTSCWSCNYGKSGYTLWEIGLDDPR